VRYDVRLNRCETPHPDPLPASGESELWVGPDPLRASGERELWDGPGPLASGESVLWVADSDGGDRNWRWRILLGARAIWCAGLVREAKRISTRGVCLRGCCFYRALECDMVRLVLILCAGGVWVFQCISVWHSTGLVLVDAMICNQISGPQARLHGACPRGATFREGHES
jgi:hypothetical protein